MQVIWKYVLTLEPEQQIQTPGKPHRYLTVQNQRGRLCLWALVESGRALQARKIRVVGTGGDANGVSENGYIGTVQDGPYVWHVFDGGPA